MYVYTIIIEHGEQKIANYQKVGVAIVLWFYGVHVCVRRFFWCFLRITQQNIQIRYIGMYMRELATIFFTV